MTGGVLLRLAWDSISFCEDGESRVQDDECGFDDNGKGLIWF